jgi:formylglycine-generating enzyme required for sulfatase activity
MSPEQARGGPVDARSDLYSLGVLLYRACTGELPLKARDTLGMLSALALEIPAEPRSHVPTLPAGLNDLIVSLLAKRPEDRPRSAAAVASRLAALQDPSGPRRPAAVGRAASWGVLCGACLAGLAVAGFLASRAGSRPGPTPTGGLPTRLENRVGMEFMLVPKGRLFAGGGGGQVGEREVTVENFYLGKFEVTQGQWQAVTGSNPSYFSRTGGGQAEVADVTDAELGRFPVDSVSWHDCQHFAEALTRAEGASGRSYRLPTADEWEYACRGGPPNTPADHSFDFYPERPANILLPAQANFKDAGRNRPAPVGSYPPNRLGLHDLHGNVWEWCADATADGADRFFRGGGWSYEAGQCRAAVRETNPPTTRIYPIGVRLVLVAAGN